MNQYNYNSNIAKHGLKRKEEIIMNRLRIGQTFLTHNHLVANIIPPVSDSCGVAIMVKHNFNDDTIIIECQKYEEMRSKNQIPQQIGLALRLELQSTTNTIMFLKNIKLNNLILIMSVNNM